MRVLSTVLVLLCAFAVFRASVEDPMTERILQRAAEVPEDAEYVFAEVVEDIKNPVPSTDPMDLMPSVRSSSPQMVAVELEATVDEQDAREAAATQAAFPGYPAGQPGAYAQYASAPGAFNTFAHPYLANMRYASAAPAALPASLTPGNAYGQYGFPYSAFPPIPPPMPTYLPPPPYIPLPTPAAAAAGGSH
jgi:hypothetical protein